MNTNHFDSSQLHDIHLPQHVAWWPLGWGWWIVIAVVLLIAGTLSYYYYRRWRYRTQHYALQTLQQIQQSQLMPHEKIAALSILLRRIALSYYPRRQVAGLHGQAWLTFLAESAQLPQIKSATAQLLICAPYQNQLEREPDALFNLATLWIKNFTQRAHPYV